MTWYESAEYRGKERGWRGWVFVRAWVWVGGSIKYLSKRLPKCLRVQLQHVSTWNARSRHYVSFRPKGWFHFSIVTAHKFFVLPNKFLPEKPHQNRFPISREVSPPASEATFQLLAAPLGGHKHNGPNRTSPSPQDVKVRVQNTEMKQKQPVRLQTKNIGNGTKMLQNDANCTYYRLCYNMS